MTQTSRPRLPAKSPQWLRRRAGGETKFFFSSESSFSWLEWLAMPHTLKAQHRVQWVATPLSWYTHFSSPHGVDQVPQFCLHRIELQPSRTAIQRLIPLNQVGDVNSVKFTLYIIQAVRNSCSPLRSGSRRRQKGPVRTPQIEQSQV